MRLCELHRFYAPLIALLMLLLPACTANLPAPAPAATTVESALSPTPLQTEAVPSAPSPQVENTPAQETPPASPSTKQPSLPTAPPPPEGPQLAFLQDNDIWLLDSPEGQAYPLTFAGDILSFAWSPDGERLAAFNGKAICIFHRDGSIRTACLELGLNDQQAEVKRKILWSPQQNWIVLWNPDNPRDEDAIGWIIVALDTTNAMWRIVDPVDWGASLAPGNEAGGATGQPLFLPDGRLVGTLSHRNLCASGGCRYQLFEFDINSLNPGFKAFPNRAEEGWSEGMNLILSPDGGALTNYGAFISTCDSFQTLIDRYDLSSGNRQTYTLDKEVVANLDFSPDQNSAVLARTAGCSQPEQTTWNQSCGLSQGFEPLAMQLWQPETDKRTDLPAGLFPAWSPDGKWIAFSSCLKESPSGEWETDAEGSASIYLTQPDSPVKFISEGSDPAWRPR